MNKLVCKHFNGVTAITCKAGVDYRKHVDGPEFGWLQRLPCIKISDANNVVACEKYQELSEAELLEQAQQFDAIVAAIKLLSPAIARIKANQRGRDWQGVIECPVCKNRLHIEHIGYNGHVRARCETQNCFNMME